MPNYSKNKNALSMPWVESPFFYELLKDSNLTEDQKKMCIDYHENGYIIVDTEISDEEIESVTKDMYKALEDEATKFHADHFQYTESKRLFELWKTSKSTAELCMNKKVNETLSILYNKEPLPFSTINFIKGSNQPLHSDIIHFHTVPSLWMCGVWVALEDVDETNGSLKIIPGSHKWKPYEYDELKLPHPDDIENGEEVNYRVYEDFLIQLCKVKKEKPYIAKLKKGQALIWAANLLHGGSNVEGVTDFTKTRLTQAQHYFFKGCDEYYHPMFTRKYKGQYATKWCDDKNNIKTYLETGEVKMFDKKITL
jgi:ectoine hydroxylase-related dioxygenase (phytanoyl-CoA dioxygenase family)